MKMLMRTTKGLGDLDHQTLEDEAYCMKKREKGKTSLVPQVVLKQCSTTPKLQTIK